MERKIPCFCDNSFTVEAPEKIALDLNPGYMDEIQNGTFMSFLCPSCGKKHKPEFPGIPLAGRVPYCRRSAVKTIVA